MTAAETLDALLQGVAITDWHDQDKIAAITDLLLQEGRELEAELIRALDHWIVETGTDRPYIVGGTYLHVSLRQHKYRKLRREYLRGSLLRIRLRVDRTCWQLVDAGDVLLHGHHPAGHDWRKTRGAICHILDVQYGLRIRLEHAPLIVADAPFGMAFYSPIIV